MKHTAARTVMAVIYFVTASVMYIFNEAYFTLGVDFMVKYVLAMALIALSFLIFLVSANVERARILFRYTLLLALPNLMILFVSLLLWAVNVSSWETIRGGIFLELYQVNMVAAMAGILYVFGSRGIWLNMAAILTANLLQIGRLMLEGGIAEYLLEMKDLIVTFAGTVGPLAAGSELHEITFALGISLLFLFFAAWEKRRPWYLPVFLFLTAFCYLSGLKRIGIAAVGLGAAAGIALHLVIRDRESRRGWLMFFAVLAMALLYGYLVLVRNGLFDYLAVHYDIDTMGRRTLSRLAEEYYRVTPDFLGKGSGFVASIFSHQTDGAFSALHNDILQVYIETGFWGFWLWAASYLPVRVYFVTRWQGVRGGILCLVYAAYVLATAATDNTLFYVYVTGMAAILIMGYRLEELEQPYGGGEGGQEEKQCGFR